MEIADVPVVILAGGKGSRLGELTKTVPKPLVKVGGEPLLKRIMQSYASHGCINFIILTGHMSEAIRKEVWSWVNLPSNFTLDFVTGEVVELGEKPSRPWRVTVLDTGGDSETQLRLAKAMGYLTDFDSFFLTYGDGVSDLDFSKQLEFHLNHGKVGTITAVSPPSKYGHLELGSEGEVLKFAEKPAQGSSVINGGFMLFNSKRLVEFIDGRNVALEHALLPALAEERQLIAFEHYGFWKSVDTPKDKAEFDELIANGTFRQEAL